MRKGNPFWNVVLYVFSIFFTPTLPGTRTRFLNSLQNVRVFAVLTILERCSYNIYKKTDQKTWRKKWFDGFCEIIT